MKTIRFIFIMLAITTAIGPIGAQNKPITGVKNKVLVYYFHGTNRCPTCLAIEENTKKALQTWFGKELKDGTIKFQAINVDEKANEKLAEKYEASGSALWVSTIIQGKEVKKDMTNFAFSYGRSNPEKFMTGIKNEIAKDLK